MGQTQKNTKIQMIDNFSGFRSSSKKDIFNGSLENTRKKVKNLENNQNSSKITKTSDEKEKQDFKSLSKSKNPQGQVGSPVTHKSTNLEKNFGKTDNTHIAIVQNALISSNEMKAYNQF